MGNFDKSPMACKRILFSIKVPTSRWIVSTKSAINARTSSFGLPQFSVEKAYNVRYSTPNSAAASVVDHLGDARRAARTLAGHDIVREGAVTLESLEWLLERVGEPIEALEHEQWLVAHARDRALAPVRAAIETIVAATADAAERLHGRC